MRTDIKEIEKFNVLLQKTFQKNSLPLIKGITFDSRLVKQGDLFLPLIGENKDGHKFIPDAIDNGAALIISENPVESFTHLINVESTWQFLREFTLEWRQTFSCPFIGITGTNGKTTTKELFCHVLKDSMKVMHTSGNFNSTTGVPLSLFGFEVDAECCVIEMGTSEPGEITAIAEMVQPNIGLITNIGEAHIEYFGSIEKIAVEKSALFTALPQDGQAIVNLDDPFISKMKISCSQISYAFNTPADYKGHWTNPGQFDKLTVNGNIITLPTRSESLGNNALAVFTTAAQFGISPELISERIRSFNVPRGRGEIITIDKIKLINDSYNANLESARAGIEYLGAMALENRKIAVIGDMLELGNLEKEHHSKLGKILSEKQVDAVFAYGELTEHTIKAMNGTTAFHQFYDDKSQLVDDLKKFISDGDIIYLKGSRGMKMEEIIEGLKS